MPIAQTHSPERMAFAMVCVATVLLSFKGVFARLAMDAGLTVSAVLLLRAACAVPLFWAIMRMRPSAMQRRYTRRDVYFALACGNLFSLATVLDIYVISIMDLGVSRAVLFTFPLFVQLLGMLHERRLPKKQELLTFAIAYVGLLLMLGVMDSNSQNIPLVGVVCSLGSAASYGAYLYYGRGLTQRLGSSRFTVLSNLSTLLVFALAAPWVVQAADWQLSADGLGWVACLVVFATVLPFVLLFEGMRFIEAAPATLISLASPVISLSMAAWLFAERISGLQMLGFALVLGGVALLRMPLRENR